MSGKTAFAERLGREYTMHLGPCRFNRQGLFYVTMSAAGIVLLAHGSRGEKLEGARVREVVDLLRRRMANGDTVSPAFLQFNRPDLKESIATLVSAGARDIVVLPYFLFEGAHYHQHIPAELDSIRTKYPGVNITMARSLGVDHRLIDILENRLKEARGPGGVAGGPGPSGAAAISEIEKQSFAQISAHYPELDQSAEGLVRKRVLHATANPELSAMLKFHDNAIKSGLSALGSGKPIVADVRMVSVGINRQLAANLGCPVFCAIEQAGTASSPYGSTKSAAGMKLLSPSIPGAVIAIGNAPTALLSLLDMLAAGLEPPSLVVGVPVGFISAAESKEKLVESGVPYITLPGRQGGSPMAAAIINALLRMAS